MCGKLENEVYRRFRGISDSSYIIYSIPAWRKTCTVPHEADEGRSMTPLVLVLKTRLHFGPRATKPDLETPYGSMTGHPNAVLLLLCIRPFCYSWSGALPSKNAMAIPEYPTTMSLLCLSEQDSQAGQKISFCGYDTGICLWRTQKYRV